jgi:tRNA modification GTPase
MVHDLDDTIAAIASPPGAAARGIIRLSGPRARQAVGAIWLSDAHADICTVRRASVLAGHLRIEDFTAPVPGDVYIWPTARSYTRQPTVEIHTVGSAPVLEAILRSLCRHGARLAEPGEFTLRAFLAGRVDLTQAEAVLGVIDAGDRHALDVAVAQLAGGLGQPLGELRDRLLDLLAHLEAGLDFVEERIEFISRDELTGRLSAAAGTLGDLAARMSARSVLRDSFRVVLVGRANAGKSSLFNALLADHAAIVSSVPGTTRDYLTGELTIDDVRFELVDTAGTIASDRPARTGPASQIELAAQQAARDARSRADIEILCIDASRQLAEADRAELARPGAGQRVIVFTKTDLAELIDTIPGAVLTSSVTSAGLDELRFRLHAAAVARQSESADFVPATAARCHGSLRAAAEALDRALQIIADEAGEELVAAEIRAALDELGQVVGAVYTEDLLDRIFSRFCIGK